MITHLAAWIASLIWAATGVSATLDITAQTPDQQARHAAGVNKDIGPVVSTEQINADVTCYAARATKATSIRGIALSKGEYVNYCSDGWLRVQINGDDYQEVKP